MSTPKTTRAEGALEIAEFEGYIPFEINQVAPASLHEYQQLKDYALKLFSSFDGLMPIRCRIHKNEQGNFQIKMFADFIEVRQIVFIGKNQRIKIIRFDINDDFQEIDALQEAILFYHRNNGRKMDTDIVITLDNQEAILFYHRNNGRKMDTDIVITLDNQLYNIVNDLLYMISEKEKNHFTKAEKTRDEIIEQIKNLC